MTGTAWGIEVSFRLEPGSAEVARTASAALTAAGPDAVDHVLFLDDAAGGYGHLAVWDHEDAARGFAARPGAQAAVARVAAHGAAKVHIRCYTIERPARTV